MLAQARQIHHEGVFELAVDLLLHVLEVHILGTLGEFGAEDFLPVRPPLNFLHPLPADGRTRAGGGHGFRFRRVLQVRVVVVPRLVVVVDDRHIGIGEDIRQNPPVAALFRRNGAISTPFPAAIPALLVLPLLGITDAGLGLDIIEPGVFHTVATGPDVLTGYRTGMAANAFVQVQDHGNLCAYFHVNEPPRWRHWPKFLDPTNRP